MLDLELILFCPTAIECEALQNQIHAHLLEHHSGDNAKTSFSYFTTGAVPSQDAINELNLSGGKEWLVIDKTNNIVLTRLKGSQINIPTIHNVLLAIDDFVPNGDGTLTNSDGLIIGNGEEYSFGLFGLPKKFWFWKGVACAVGAAITKNKMLKTALGAGAAFAGVQYLKS